MVFVWIAVVLIALLLVTAYIGFQVACRRNDEMTKNLDKVLTRPIYRDCKKEILEARDWLASHPREDVRIQSFDGLTLAGEYYPCENARGTIIMFHGWRSAPLLDCGCAVQSYHRNRLNTLLVYQRAQGKSEGKYITFGIRERRDVHAWVKWHTERFGKDVPILLTGLSMGASTVLMACGEPFEADVRGVIADCGFTSPREIIASVAHSAHVPAFPLVPLMSLMAKLFAGFGFRDYSTVDAVKGMTLPVFFAHGEKDTFVPCYMTKTAYDACTSEDKTLLLVPEARHGMSYILDRENYEQTIRDFIDRTIPTA